MPADQSFDDIWTLQSSVTELRTERLPQIKEVEDLIPLDDQFGVTMLKTVPEKIFAHIFGQPEPRQSKVAAANNDPAKVLPLQTYAILDAAKVANLAELLDASGLEHRCLFKGRAYDELKDVAPWVVRLELDNAFTRNLFTRSNAQWHLWDKEPGIYLRSSASLDTMWKHFRKFTKVQDEQGKWYYYRFWEVRVLAEARTEQLTTMFENLYSDNISTIICIDTHRGRARIFGSTSTTSEGTKL